MSPASLLIWRKPADQRRPEMPPLSWSRVTRGVLSALMLCQQFRFTALSLTMVEGHKFPQL